ncbi:hypothetical protein K504DRAFT_463600 [Pleomassaria siparia CBS 279.74]|uniref:SnoaL-like domain-containing protein n=1 Tax=Pleomassaria siparia CBS 279.74 TaxID=1314801 RepID=A0A6G1JSJ6_9PLEO|nr:hypothetical protein K504DRAFT_463600 [Pleomassaria siparia CBS 279.74]
MTELKDKDKDTKAIKAVIQKFFDAINAADTDALGSHFSANANLTIIRQEPPLPPSSSDSKATADEEVIKVVIRTTIEKFIALLEDGKKQREGKPGPELHEAPDLDGTDVKIDALFASAWSPFKVTFDGALHHYGVMVYTLGKDNGEWKIEGLTQSYRRTPGWERSESVL